MWWNSLNNKEDAKFCFGVNSFIISKSEVWLREQTNNFGPKIKQLLEQTCLNGLLLFNCPLVLNKKDKKVCVIVNKAFPNCTSRKQMHCSVKFETSFKNTITIIVFSTRSPDVL